MDSNPKPKYKTFILSEPYAGKIIKLAKKDRRTYSETLRILIDFYEANAPHPNGNGKHEACN